MITAAQALALVEQSTINMDQRLKSIGDKIEQAANLGKREIWLDTALPSHLEFMIVERPYETPEFTPIQRLVRDRLTSFGFGMKIATRETQIGGGLGSMDDKVITKQLPYIKVTW